MLHMLTENKILFDKLRLAQESKITEVLDRYSIVIDITNKPWVKQKCSIDKNKNNYIFNIMARHFFHCRCECQVTLRDGSIYCEKCGYKIPYKSVCYRPNLSEKLLKIKNIYMGKGILKNDDLPIIVIDLNYARRKRIEKKV